MLAKIAKKTGLTPNDRTPIRATSVPVLCDRGTVDGAAYWPGPDDLWSAVVTTLSVELQRGQSQLDFRAMRRFCVALNAEP